MADRQDVDQVLKNIMGILAVQEQVAKLTADLVAIDSKKLEWSVELLKQRISAVDPRASSSREEVQEAQDKIDFIEQISGLVLSWQNQLKELSLSHSQTPLVLKDILSKKAEGR